MEKPQTSICGIKCEECRTFVATKDNDDRIKNQAAEQWSRIFQIQIRPESIRCNGCVTPGGPKFIHCRHCAIRACGIKKGVPTCAHCPDFACKRLQDLFTWAPMAEQNLADIRTLLETT